MDGADVISYVWSCAAGFEWFQRRRLGDIVAPLSLSVWSTSQYPVGLPDAIGCEYLRVICEWRDRFSPFRSFVSGFYVFVACHGVEVT
jgi:hypothetical protein